MSKPHLTTVLLAGTLLVAAVVAPARPALAFTPVSELQDVSPDHWAYQAIQSLVEKYEVMEGFPDRTFRGPKTLTRYELAAALAKVMARVEQMVATATGQPISLEPGVDPEDLRTIARLQREFRDELEVLKGRVDTLDTRMSAVEKRVRLSGEMIAETRDYLGAGPLAAAALPDLRVRNRVNLDAALTDELSYKGTLVWDVYGQTMANAFLLAPGAGATPFNEIYVQRAYGSYKPGWMSLHGGLVNVSEVTTLGSTLFDPFKNAVWREGIGGYGFVGTPGMVMDPAAAHAPMAAGVERVAGPAGLAASNQVWWLPGTDVANQALDPNATMPVFPRTNMSAVYAQDAGPFNLAVAAYMPGVTGRSLDRLAQLNYPSSFAGYETYGSGMRMLTALGADFGMVRAQLAAKTPGTFAGGFGDHNKTVTGTVDLGSEALGLRLEAVSHTAFTGNFLLDRAAMTLGSNDLFGTGFGLGLGLNAGTAVSTVLQAPNSTFLTPAGGRSLLQGTAGMDWASYGLTLRFPGFSIFPTFGFAAQQTAGPGFGETIASGLTLQTEMQLFQLPAIRLEYSMGKFDPLPAGGGADNGLMDQSTQVSHEQLSAQFVLPF